MRASYWEILLRNVYGAADEKPRSSENTPIRWALDLRICGIFSIVVTIQPGTVRLPTTGEPYYNGALFSQFPNK
jgi:hypothetical protein